MIHAEIYENKVLAWLEEIGLPIQKNLNYNDPNFTTALSLLLKLLGSMN